MAEWQYQTAVCSQTFEDLPDQLEQLFNPVVGRIFSSQKRVIYHCRRPTINISFTSKSGTQRGRGWVQEETQRRPAQAAALPLPPPPLPQPAPRANAPTPFKTVFDGATSTLAFFMNRAWKSNAEKQPKRQFTRHSFPCQGEGCQTAAPTTSMKCFRCGQHQASECLAPAPVPQGRAPAPPKWKRAPRKPPEKKKICVPSHQVPNPQQITGEGTLAAGVPIVQDADSEEDDPM
ncbi:hypothetical protein E2320_020684, partial [Naja naja]